LFCRADRPVSRLQAAAMAWIQPQAAVEHAAAVVAEPASLSPASAAPDAAGAVEAAAELPA
jgi:hypothetical protein